MQDELGCGPVGPAGPGSGPYQEGDTGPGQLPQVLMSSFSEAGLRIRISFHPDSDPAF